jgi:hypothetical protein
MGCLTRRSTLVLRPRQTASTGILFNVQEVPLPKRILILVWNNYSTNFGSIVQVASPLLVSWVIFVSTIHDGAELPGNRLCALPRLYNNTILEGG